MTTVLITAPETAGREIAEELIEQGLAACVNIMVCDSIYTWEGEVTTDEEVLMLAKTTTETYDELRATVLEMHPYDVPAIERFDEDDILEAYAKWRDDVVNKE